MGLVDYASDESDTEQVTKPSAEVQKPPSAAKASFQKVVDKSNPHKIRVNLGAPSERAGSDVGDIAEPEPKRIKLGSGGGGGINSFLPAPKRPTAAANGQGAAGRQRGLGSGINLKTGAEPAFSREPPLAPGPSVESNETPVVVGAAESEPSTSIPRPSASANDSTKPATKRAMFKPLSVSRKPQKKKPPVPDASSSEAASLADDVARVSKVPAPKPKVSLFSVEPEMERTEEVMQPSPNYEPLLFGASEHPDGTAPPVEEQGQLTSLPPERVPALSDPQSLDSIASDLNLTAAQRRQLFGRGAKSGGPGAGGYASAVNVVNFNTDAEYAANEEIRASGQQPEQQHRVVRSINTSGRNTLRQLVNVVNTHSDALEEHIAKGKRNQHEAGSKYGCSLVLFAENGLEKSIIVLQNELSSFELILVTARDLLAHN